MIKAVLFDMDGILLDSEAEYMKGTIQVMRSLGFQGADNELYSVIGTTMDGTYDLLYRLLGGRVERSRIVQANESWFREHPIQADRIMFEGVPQVLSILREHGIKTACCSSSSHELIVSSLRSMGILDLFDFIKSGEDIRAPKPAPDIYQLAALNLGVKAEECIVYEDSKLGIEAGKAAGMYVIAREDLRFGQNQSEADLLVKDIQHMGSFVLKEEAVWRK